MLSIHLELLDIEQKKTWQRLLGFSNGILGGGTALSMQLAHRRSYDFDIFVYRKIYTSDKNLLFKLIPPQRINLDTQYQLDYSTKSGVKITLWHNLQKHIFPPLKTDGLPILDYRDIAADKAHVINRRATWRDYADLFYLLKYKITLKQLISYAQKKYNGFFNAKLLMEELTYFKDINLVPIDWVEKKYTDKEIKEFLVQTVKDFRDNEIIPKK